MSSVLETFYILFKGDTTDLKKNTDDAISSTKKLGEQSEIVGRKFMGLAGQIAGAFAAFASIHSVISGLSSAINYDIELGKTSRALGVNVSELDVWGRSVKQAGGSAEGFQGSLKNLAAHFHTTADVALKQFPKLADVFGGLNKYSAMTLGKVYGLDEGTILLLQKGRREVESVIKRQRELGVVTKQDAEISLAYSNELDNLGVSFRTLFNSIALDSLPILTSFFKMLQHGLAYLTDHKDFVIGAFVGIAAAAFSAAIAFGFITLEGLLLSAAIILLIGLFALLWDDTQGYFKGSKSLIGEYIDEWKRLGKLIDGIIDSWTEKFLDFLSKFELLKPIVDFIRGESNTSFYSQNKNGKKAVDLLSFASSTPLNSQTSNSVLNNSAYSKNFTINSMPITVNTQATDAVGVAAHLGLALPDHLNQASNYFADNIYG